MAHRKQFNDLCQALEFTEYEHDKHADIIRHVIRNPEFSVNTIHGWRGSLAKAALHVACGDTIQSSVGAQLLLSDKRCDVNLSDFTGDTAMITALKQVRSENDIHAQIVRLLLAHPRIDINQRTVYIRTALHQACAESVKSHVGAQLLLSDERCDVNLRDDEGLTPLMTVGFFAQSTGGIHRKILNMLLERPKTDANILNKCNEPALMYFL